MTMARRIGLLLLLLSGAISILWGRALGQAFPGGPVDFQAVYYGSRTLIQHHNPYVVSEVGGVYLSLPLQCCRWALPRRCG